MRFASREQVDDLNTSEELVIATSGESVDKGGEIIWVADKGEEVVLHEEKGRCIQALAADDDNICIAGGISDPFIRDLRSGEIIAERPERTVKTNPFYSSLSFFDGDLYAEFGPNVYDISRDEKVKSEGSLMLETDNNQLLGCDGASGNVFDVLEGDSVAELTDEFQHSVRDYHPGEEILFIRHDRNGDAYVLESESGRVYKRVYKEGELIDNVTKAGSDLYLSAAEDGDAVIYRHPENEMLRKDCGRGAKIADMTSVNRDVIDDLRGDSR